MHVFSNASPCLIRSCCRVIVRIFRFFSSAYHFSEVSLALIFLDIRFICLHYISLNYRRRCYGREYLPFYSKHHWWICQFNSLTFSFIYLIKIFFQDMPVLFSWSSPFGLWPLITLPRPGRIFSLDCWMLSMVTLLALSIKVHTNCMS